LERRPFRKMLLGSLRRMSRTIVKWKVMKLYNLDERWMKLEKTSYKAATRTIGREVGDTIKMGSK
jgi:6-phosphogluconolactonase/glucosamine-6-phosphate isomerase/deaminase